MIESLWHNFSIAFHFVMQERGNYRRVNIPTNDAYCPIERTAARMMHTLSFSRSKQTAVHQSRCYIEFETNKAACSALLKWFIMKLKSQNDVVGGWK